MSVNLVSRPFTKGAIIPDEPKYSAESTRENNFKVFGDFLRDYVAEIETSNSFSINFSGGMIGGADLYLPAGKEIFVVADETFARDIYVIVETDNSTQLTTMKTIELNANDELILTKDFNGIYQTEIGKIKNVEAGVVNLNNKRVSSLLKEIIRDNINVSFGEKIFIQEFEGKNPYNLGFRRFIATDTDGFDYQGVLSQGGVKYYLSSVYPTSGGNMYLRTYDLNYSDVDGSFSLEYGEARLIKAGGDVEPVVNNKLIKFSILK